jgi:hypothetical protein
VSIIILRRVLLDFGRFIPADISVGARRCSNYVSLNLVKLVSGDTNDNILVRERSPP